MGLLSLFSPIPKVATSDSLLIFEEINKQPTKVVDDLHDFYVSILEKDPSRFLIISASLNSRIIPIIDCDSIPEHNQAREYLKKREIRYAVFQSSRQPHYWIIPDMTFISFPVAWRTICYVPGSDHKYLKFTKERGYFCLRGEYKESGDAPKLVHVNCVEPNIVKFIDQLVTWFADERLDVIASTKVKRSLEHKKKKDKEAKQAAASWSY